MKYRNGRAIYNTNPLYKRGKMYDEKGEPIMARMQGGPWDGEKMHVSHHWAVVEEPVEMPDGHYYRLSTDSHGFTLIWVKGDDHGA